MAFSKAPSQSTYQTKEVKLLWSQDTRETSTSTDFITRNAIFELTKDGATKDNTYTMIKRDGILKHPSASSSTNIRGMYYWEDQDKLLVADGAVVKAYKGSTGVFQADVYTFPSTTGVVGFSEFNYDDGSTKVIVGDGTKLISVDSTNTAVASTSVDLPPFQPDFLVLDGYLFLIKTGTQDIYNSNLGDPLAWTAGDFLTAEMLPDSLIRISRLNNYLIALGSDSIEYFFDAGNASGSPLQRNDTPVKQIGYLGGYAKYSNKIYFVGQSSTTSPDIYVLEDFKMDVISNAPIRRFLRKDAVYTGSIITLNGHDYYVISVGDVSFAMDIETKVWIRLGYQSTDKLTVSFAVNVPMDGVGNSSVFYLPLIGGIHYLKRNYYQDNGVNFEVVCQLPKQEFDTRHEKYMSRLVTYADKTTGDLNISWSDDDYTTFSTPRPVDLSLEKPKLNRLGRFVSRAFKLSFLSNSYLRMYYISVDFNIGTK